MILKICFLSHKFYPDIGGIESNSEILALAFAKAGHTVHLITWSPSAGKEDWPYKVVRNPGVSRLIKECLWADILFENNPVLRLSWPNLFIGRPSVIVLHTWVTRLDGSLASQDRVKLWWLGRAQRVIVVSEALRKRCWPAATTIGNPYQSDQFRLMPGISRTRDFVFLGRLVSDKGTDQAIAAIHQLTNGPNKHLFPSQKPTLTIIGSGPDSDKLKQLVASLGLEQQIRFTGAVRGEELTACLSRHRFLLVPSAWEEPFGMVVLEGMACGCLPIVSDGGGLPDAVGKAGLTFRRNDVGSLVACIEYILSHPELEQQIRNETPGHLAAHHPVVIAERYLGVIEAIMQTRD